MGILDSLLQSGAVGEMAKRVINDPRVMDAASSFLSSDDDSVGGNNGGLGGVLESLQAGGLGGAVSSWLGDGGNEAVSPAQLESALGDDALRQFASKAGVDADQSAGVLADLLPELVNQLTPNGQAPQGGALGGLLRQLIR
jgi:uncharacterized protein YidB (DUF937 family)